MTGVALVSRNGHQIQDFALKGKGVRLVCTYGFDIDGYPRAASLDEIANNREVRLVSLCCDKRGGQGEAIELFLNAGKHVLAEKPFCMDYKQAKRLIALAKSRKLFLGELTPTVFCEPFLSLKALLKTDTIGEIKQFFVQKSYPYAEWREIPEEVDGGIVLQCAVHGLRIVEQCLGLDIQDCTVVKGASAGACTSASLLLTTRQGAAGTVNANYLNPMPATGVWGFEKIIVFGAKGCIEADTRKKTIEVLTDSARCIAYEEREEDYFGAVIDFISGLAPRPLPAEKDLSATLTLLKAYQKLC